MPDIGADEMRFPTLVEAALWEQRNRQEVKRPRICCPICEGPRSAERFTCSRQLCRRIAKRLGIGPKNEKSSLETRR